MRVTRTIRATWMALLTAALLGACSQPAGPPAAQQNPGSTADAEIPAAQGKIVLDVWGDISKSNSSRGLKLDLATLESMPMTEATLYEPFVRADVSFTGVLLSDFLETAGSDPGATGIFMKALDDYSVETSIDDALAASAMLATQEEGSAIKLRNGGPVRLVFLEDSGIATNTDMWIWSVNRMKVHH